MTKIVKTKKVTKADQVESPDVRGLNLQKADITPAPVADKVTKAEPKVVPIFDPDEYISRTYGELYDLVAVQRALLREIVILGHKG